MSKESNQKISFNTEIFSNSEEDNIILTLLRNEKYVNNLYMIKEEVKFSKNINKIYAITKEKNFGVVITKILNVSLVSNPNFKKRLISTVKLIEENLLLVENLWLEEINKDLYNLYISEYTKSTYKSEFNLLTLSFYLNETKGVEYKTNIKLLLNILKKLQILHKKMQLSHLNLNPNNIYFSTNSYEVYFGPSKLCESSFEDNCNLWYMSPEYCYIEKIINEDLQAGIYNDIWSIGCILCEMFFVVCPLFQAFSLREKMKKNLEILGVPPYSDVDYMTRQEYSILQSTDNTLKNKIRLLDLINNKDIDENGVGYNSMITIKNNIFNLMNMCLVYNRKNRISIDDLIKEIVDLDDRYIKAKPMKNGIKTIINRENLLQANVPISNGNISNNRKEKTYNLTNQNKTMNNFNITNQINNTSQLNTVDNNYRQNNKNDNYENNDYIPYSKTTNLNKNNIIIKKPNNELNNISEYYQSMRNTPNSTIKDMKNYEFDNQNINYNISNKSNNSPISINKYSKNNNKYKPIEYMSDNIDNYVYKPFKEKEYLSKLGINRNNTPQKNNNNNLSLNEINSRIQKKDEEEYNRLNNKLDDLVNFINNMQNL
jgi:hypothetical protein